MLNIAPRLWMLEQQEMTLVVCVQLYASGHTLVMHTWSLLRKRIHLAWRRVDGMMIFGRKLVSGILWMGIMEKLVKNLRQPDFILYLFFFLKNKLHILNIMETRFKNEMS